MGRIAYQIKRYKGEQWHYVVKETFDLYPDELKRTFVVNDDEESPIELQDAQECDATEAK